MAYARLDPALDVVREFPMPGVPSDYHGDIAARMVEVPEGLAPAEGWTFAGGAFSPPPPPSPDDLLAYASIWQDSVLHAVWSFVVGPPEAPKVLTTRLDAKGISAMQSLTLWGLINLNKSGAKQPYSNVDLAAFTLSPAEVISLTSQAGDVVSASFATLNALAAEIRAEPPAVTAYAAIEEAPWPRPVPSAAGGV